MLNRSSVGLARLAQIVKFMQFIAQGVISA